MTGASPLARLCHKYELLGELRRARARGEAIPPRAVFKALAGEFPGALFELDRLPLAEIDARRDALAGVQRGAAPAPWMLAMATYHAVYRAALHVKAHAPPKASISAEEAATLAARASEHAGAEISAALAARMACPEGGRIAPLVLSEAAARHGIDTATLKEWLFGSPLHAHESRESPCRTNEPYGD